MADNNFQKRAIAYSLLAHIKTTGTFAGGPLDIFIPLVKNILHELFSNGTPKRGENIQELCDGIFEKYNLDIPIPVMRNILLRVQEDVNKTNGREDIKVFGDNAFWIESFVFEDYREDIQRSINDVASVERTFREFCKIYKIEAENDSNAIFRFIEQNRADISYYLCHTDKEAEKHNTLAAQFVDTFRNTPQIFDKLKDMYLGSMLASYLTFQPQTAKLNVELVLDTNFIVSLLDLNTIESTKNCNTLVEVGKRLGYSFTVLHDTVIETQNLLAFKSSNLDKAIIAKNINREDIYNACDRRNLSSVDLDRIADHLEETIMEYGIHIIPHTEQWHGKVRYSKEYSVLRGLRNSDKAAFHDALAIIYVREKRGNKQIKDFEKVNCWFVNNAINHDCDNEVNDLESIISAKDIQPEIIKVDELLNILWLSNPNIGVAGNDVVDMGITAMVSSALNSALPKTRIIRELDENIQKYRKDYSITDTDVMRLSTRIANRQIKDVQSLNILADNDAKAFAALVKEESEKQDKIDQERVRKIEVLINAMNESISDLRENKERLNAKHTERMEELNKRERDLEKRTQELSKREIEINIHAEHDASEKRRIEDENRQDKMRLKKLWEKENKSREEMREKYIKKELSKWRQIALIRFLVGLFLIMGVIVLWLYKCLLPTCVTNESVSSLIESNWAPSIITLIVGLVNYFTIVHYYNCRNNPSYEINQRTLIEKDIPDDCKSISYDKFIDEMDS